MNVPWWGLWLFVLLSAGLGFALGWTARGLAFMLWLRDVEESIRINVSSEVWRKIRRLLR